MVPCRVRQEHQVLAEAERTAVSQGWFYLSDDPDDSGEHRQGRWWAGPLTSVARGAVGWWKACLGHFISRKGAGVYLSQYRFKVIQTESNMKTLDSFSVNSVLYSKIGQVKLYASWTIN